MKTYKAIYFTKYEFYVLLTKVLAQDQLISTKEVVVDVEFKSDLVSGGFGYTLQIKEQE